MPYVEKTVRSELNAGVYRPTKVGELNYIITAAVHHWLRSAGVSYNSLNAAIGVLECAKLELYRRIAAPYEDTKIKENGDIGIL
jgi:hypothetical protein